MTQVTWFPSARVPGVSLSNDLRILGLWTDSPTVVPGAIPACSIFSRICYTQCFSFWPPGKIWSCRGNSAPQAVKGVKADVSMLRTKTFRPSGCNPHSRWCTTGPLNLVMRECKSLATCTYLSISPSGTFQASQTPFAAPPFFFCLPNMEAIRSFLRNVFLIDQLPGVSECRWQWCEWSQGMGHCCSPCAHGAYFVTHPIAIRQGRRNVKSKAP